MIDEGDIWYYTTKRLNRGQFRVIGGEPPGGSSPYPRIEARHPENTSKGSWGSMKHDIYILFDGRILLCEAKDHPNKTTDDVDRLNHAVDSALWAGALWDAMDQRGLTTSGTYHNDPSSSQKDTTSFVKHSSFHQGLILSPLKISSSSRPMRARQPFVLVTIFQTTTCWMLSKTTWKNTGD